MEAYDMESPELNAQTTIDETFASSEVIVAFLVTVRDPVHIDLEENVPRASTSDGQPDSTTFPQVTEIIESGEPWGGIDAPAGGILNLTLLREIDAKADLIRNHPINTTLKPLVNDVTGAQTDGVMTLPDIFRAFMANESILTRPSKDAFGNDVPPPPIGAIAASWNAWCSTTSTSPKITLTLQANVWSKPATTPSCAGCPWTAASGRHERGQQRAHWRDAPR